jgi:hypothetical protein
VQLRGLLDSDAVQRAAADFGHSGAYAAQRFHQLRREPISRELYEKAEAEKRLELAHRGLAAEGMRRQVATTEFEANIADQDFVSKAASRAARSTGGFFTDLWSAFHTQPFLPRTAREGGGGASGPAFDPSRLPPEPWAKDPQMEEQTELLKQLNQNVRQLGRGAPAPNAHSE